MGRHGSSRSRITARGEIVRVWTLADAGAMRRHCPKTIKSGVRGSTRSFETAVPDCSPIEFCRWSYVNARPQNRFAPHRWHHPVLNSDPDPFSDFVRPVPQTCPRRSWQKIACKNTRYDLGVCPKTDMQDIEYLSAGAAVFTERARGRECEAEVASGRGDGRLRRTVFSLEKRI